MEIARRTRRAVRRTFSKRWACGLICLFEHYGTSNPGNRDWLPVCEGQHTPHAACGSGAERDWRAHGVQFARAADESRRRAIAGAGCSISGRNRFSGGSARGIGCGAARLWLHGAGGLDEISLAGETMVAEVKSGSGPAISLLLQRILALRERRSKRSAEGLRGKCGDSFVRFLRGKDGPAARYRGYECRCGTGGRGRGFRISVEGRATRQLRAPLQAEPEKNWRRLLSSLTKVRFTGVAVLRGSSRLRPVGAFVTFVDAQNPDAIAAMLRENQEKPALAGGQGALGCERCRKRP